MKLFDGIEKDNSINKLMDLISNNKFPHSIILECKNQEKSSRVAADICKYFVCVSDKDKPCRVCNECIKVDKGIHPDVFVTGGSGNLRSIHIETIRYIREDAYIMPNEASKKIYIINDANEMSLQAQNAFLKILEEPPHNVIFILTCKDSANILGTIKSRCQNFLLDSIVNAACDSEVIELSKNIALSIMDSDRFKALSYTAGFIKNKGLFIAVLNELNFILTDALYLSFDVNIKQRYGDQSNKLALNLTKDDLMQLINKVQNFKTMLDQNVNYNLLITAFCIDITKRS